MKKFMKVCGITALIMAVVGLVLTGIGTSVEGKRLIGEAVDKVTDGKVNISLPDFSDNDWGITIGEELGEELSDGLEELGDELSGGLDELLDIEALYEIDEDIIFDSDRAISMQNVEKEDLGTNITQFSIEVGGSAIAIEKSEDDHFYLDATGVGKFQFYKESGGLVVKAAKGTIDLDELGAGQITLYVPEAGIEKFEAEVGAGMLDLGELSVGELSLELGVGAITADYVKGRECKINVDMGRAAIDNMDIEHLRAEVGAGEFVAKGNISEKLEVDCAMGNVEVTLEGSEQDFDYELEAAMGNVSVGAGNYSGIGQKRIVDNNAEKSIEIDSAMGNTAIYFTE